MGEFLFGREAELKRLDAAWEEGRTHVVSVVAWGGVGKTALVKHWLGRMAADGWRGAERVFDWSFYSQGTSEQRAGSADVFIHDALVWFGDDDPTKGSPWDKGARLAERIAHSRTLLVLDGLEPLQHPPGAMTGRLKDPAMQALLTGLAAKNPGLCILTTREAVTELGHLADTTSPRINLEHLSSIAGAQLLFKMGVRRDGATALNAASPALQSASEQFGGHALALTLLGSYLAEVCGGGVGRIGEVDLLDEDEAQGGHARRVLRSYERWLGDDSAEVAALRLMGLFDRPADAGCLSALRAEPAIEGLTDALVPLSDRDWQRVISRLQKLHLLTQSDEANPKSQIPNPKSQIDCHPLIRTYFADQLRTSRPAAWHAAHRRLYEHLTTTTPDQPDTLEGLMPLYHAVQHGCLVGLHEQALVEVLRWRIHRMNEYFSTAKLGAFGAELSTLAHLFARPWDQPAANLTAAAQAWVLNEAGIALRAQGRLKEAVQPMQAGLELRIAQGAWKNAAIIASNLSELHLTLGELSAAVRAAEQSVELCDCGGDAFTRMVNRTTLADALHQCGRRSEAASLFQEAETMQKERQPTSPLLYSLQGFQYCDLLLNELEGGVWNVVCGAEAANALPQDALTLCREVEKRAAQALEWYESEGERWLLDIALDHLTLGRAYGLIRFLIADCGLRIEEDAEGDSAIQLAERHLNEAVSGLRAAGQQQELPRGLLARAGFRVTQQRWAEAETDLNEAWGIAERGSMRLYMADAHLTWTRLHLLRYRQQPNGRERTPCRSPARQHLAEAAALIQQTGYHRRDAELAGLQTAVNGG